MLNIVDIAYAMEVCCFKDRMNHLESQQMYDKKRLSTHTVHLVEMEKSTSETMTTFDMCVLRLCFQDVENGGY